MSNRLPSLIACACAAICLSVGHGGRAWASAWAVRPDPEVVYRLSVDSFGLGNSTDDTVLMMHIRDGSKPGFWAAERRLHQKLVGKPKVDQHAFIDGRTCPALEAAFAKLTDLPAARFGTPQSYDQVIAVFDGGEIVLSGPGEGHPVERKGFIPRGDIGRLIRLADHGGPLWSWWAAAEKDLEPCWQASSKLSDGTQVKERLGSDEQAKAEKP